MWVLAHIANEKADTLVKGPLGTQPFGGITPEDLIHALKSLSESWWENCKYAAISQYLGNKIYHITWNRQEDVALTRLRASASTTGLWLYKLHFRSSPLCSMCNAGWGPEYDCVFDCWGLRLRELCLLSVCKYH